MIDNKLNIAIVEDNHAIRRNLVEMIMNEKSFRLLGEFSNAEEAFDTIPHLMLELVIMDIELPGMSGIECVAKLKPLTPKTQFMMFTVFEESEQVFNALAAGASGYMLKTSSEEEIIAALNELHAGGSPMSPLIARKVVASFQKQKQEMKEVESLSSREKEILQLISEGMLYKEISDKMEISLGSVKQHLHRVYEKLHVNNRTEAINRVFR
ncbi:MAG: response regulator [Flavobacteriales bacterium]